MLFNRSDWMAPFDELRREVDRLFEGFGRRWDGSLFEPAFPAVNVWEDDENLYAEAEIPGVKREDLEVYTVGDELTIKGRREPCSDEKVSYHRRERGTGEFTRIVTLPAEVKADEVEATYRDGVLTVRMPKAESARPKRITVKAS